MDFNVPSTCVNLCTAWAGLHVQLILSDVLWQSPAGRALVNGAAKRRLRLSASIPDVRPIQTYHTPPPGGLLIARSTGFDMQTLLTVVYFSYEQNA